MLVERFGCLGGNITVVGVESLAWYRREKTVDCEGIGIELEQRAKAMGATTPEPQSKSEAINADMFKVRRRQARRRGGRDARCSTRWPSTR